MIARLEEFGENVDHKAIGEMFIEGNRSWGLGCDLEVEGAATVVLKNQRCPRYEGLKESDLDDETIKRHCDVGVAALQPHFRSVGLDFNIREWAASEGHCDEVISKQE